MSASSPCFQGEDTGYASYRTVVVSRWPTVGPPPDFTSAEDYDRTVATLIHSGVISDAGMIYFDARLSARYPTIEIRVADACPSVDDAVLIAALARALVVTAARADAAPGDDQRAPPCRQALRSCCGPPPGGPPAPASTGISSIRGRSGPYRPQT